ncbi:unnamed protein product [Nezara viridula]|uniref:Carotenoid cleavage dioxygenase n=1 Tax=Nezara viridula TaxID=85310 RepID=A0A9P0MWU3_NEZVI|nr:unnamed protein product [Nezara viridula]
MGSAPSASRSLVAQPSLLHKKYLAAHNVGPDWAPMLPSGEYERIIQNEIDKVNAEGEEERQKRHKDGEDLIPDCDVTVWFRECKEEVVEPLAGQTSGTIPRWLNGVLIRNGPGAMTVGDYSYNHLFDGAALLHRFYIKDGSATYQCRFLQSKTYKRNQAAQRIVVNEFGTRAVADPCKTIFQKFASYFKFEDSDNCLVSVYPYKDEIYTLTEAPVMYRIDKDTLKTMNSVNISNLNNLNIVHHTSHPHVEDDGLVFNLGLSVQRKGPMYTIVEFPNTKKGSEKKDIFSEARIVGSVNCRWPFQPSYMHTFGMTKSFFVIVEQPLGISVMEKIAMNFNTKPLYNILKWNDKHPTLIHVVDRKSGKNVKTFLAEPFFYLHIINQYEDNNHVVIDICVYKNPSMIECMLIEALKTAKQNPDYAKMFRGRPFRYVLPMNATENLVNLVTLPNTSAKAYLTKDGKIFVVPELLSNMGCETPRINYPLFLGKKYRYFYAISSDVDLKNPGTLIKVDVTNKTILTWTEIDTFPSEPVFVPSPNGEDEDDGVVISTLLWGNDACKTAVIVLDAKTFTELGRTDFETTGPVPKCLHGWYFPD